MSDKPTIESNPEILAISAVHSALKDLEPDVQARVLDYVARMLKIRGPVSAAAPALPRDEPRAAVNTDVTEGSTVAEYESSTELEGVSPMAKKWMARNGLTEKQLSSVFSLGVDEIDLIAKTVPGKKKRQKMRSVFLLKGVAAYLGTGSARFTHEQVKEACLHYGAFDAPNFAVSIKSLSSEVSGSKETGYTLTPRGLAAATEMLKQITQLS